MNYPLSVETASLGTKILISSSFLLKRPLSQSETAIYRSAAVADGQVTFDGAK